MKYLYKRTPTSTVIHFRKKPGGDFRFGNSPNTITYKQSYRSKILNREMCIRDRYDITKLLNKHKSPVYRVDETKEYYRKYDYLEENLFTYGFS